MTATVPIPIPNQLQPCAGFGAPQAVFVGESQIDMLAKDLGIDPIEIRRKNGMTPNYEVPGQAFIQSCGLHQCLDKIDNYIKERGKLPANHGIGVSAYGFMSGGIFNWFDTPYAFSSAIVKVSIDGKVDLFTGACDIGQGSDTTLSMITAEELGVKLSDVRIHAADTAICPADLGAWGSRETLMNGNACKMAAADAKRQLIEFAAAKMGVNIVYDLDIRDGWIYLADRPERRVSYYEICAASNPRTRWGNHHRPRPLYPAPQRHDFTGLQLWRAGGRS